MSAPIRILIRADAGTALGTGHFARASAVAEALSGAADADILLACNADAEALVPAYFPPGIKVLALPPDDTAADVTMQLLRGIGWTPEVVYLDHYGSVREWEASASACGAQLLVIDDLDAAERADLIVRLHGGAGRAQDTIVLRGPAYIPLSPEVTAAARERVSQSGGRIRLNICFGGSDPTGETAKALEAVGALTQIDVDVVVGPGAKIDAALLAAADRMPHVTLHRSPTQERLAGLMAKADLALGAGGVMLWERLCIGTPSLVIAAAANQRPQIDAMMAAGAIRFLGDHSNVTPAKIAQGIAGLAGNSAERAALAEAGRRLVDGRGAVRLAAWIRALALDVRDVESRDGRDLLDWRTDDRNWRHNWDEAEKPAFDRHMAWLTAKLADPDCVFRIVARGTEPIGVVRFDIEDGGTAAYLSIYLVPAWHGRRAGLPVYCAAERTLRLSHPGISRISSRLDAANAASARLHRDAGFELTASRERAGWLDARKSLD